MSFFSKSEPETPGYTIIKIYKGFEIREYKPILYASVTKEGKMMDVGSSGFRELAGFIFGGNSKSKKIAMTAPVTFKPVAGETGKTEMSFTMPEGFDTNNLPKPNSAFVKIHVDKGIRLAVLEFGGFASNEKLEEKANELRKLLKNENLTWKEPYRFFAYNSPYKVFNRKNEVAFEL